MRSETRASGKFLFNPEELFLDLDREDHVMAQLIVSNDLNKGSGVPFARRK
tara:strand:- start:28385 stop:28537 length:153 start_codon:yes stop_codon:yes gene_type:complete